MKIVGRVVKASKNHPLNQEEVSLDKKPGKSLWKSTGIAGSMTTISRVLGFIRDIVIARFFGATAGVDAFIVAFKIPNFLRRLFAEGAFSHAFVPVLSEYQTKHSPDELKGLIDRVAGNLALIVGLVTVLSILAAPLLIMVFAPGFIGETEKFDLATQMLRITFPYILLISLTAFMGAILNTFGRFAIPALTPCLLNIALILAAVFLAPQMSKPITALAWGVFAGGVLQLIFQFPFLQRLGLMPRWRVDWQHPGVKKIMSLMVPALFGVSVAQINLLVDTIFASFLPAGSISWLYYSDRLMEFPLGVFGVALATVILPHLSRQHAKEEGAGFSNTIDWAMRSICLIALPAAIGLFILAGPLLTTLFQYGAFNTHDVIMSTRSLLAYAFGLQAFILVKVFASSFYAKQDIKTPVKVAVLALVSNIVFNAILIVPLAHAGLALATTLSAFINAGVLFYLLRRRQIYKACAGWGMYALRIIIANLCMIAAIWFASPGLEQWLAWGWQLRFLNLGGILCLAVIIYFASLYLLGLRFKHITHKT